MDGNEGDEVSLSEILSELELPPAGLGRWWDHLDAFFARHGGARRYGALVALVAEARAAQVAVSRCGGAG
jgi:hypothetical protein